MSGDDRGRLSGRVVGRQIAAVLEEEAVQAVDELAAREGVCRADILRRALNMLFEAQGLAVLAVPTWERYAPVVRHHRRRMRPAA